MPSDHSIADDCTPDPTDTATTYVCVSAMPSLTGEGNYVRIENYRRVVAERDAALRLQLTAEMRSTRLRALAKAQDKAMSCVMLHPTSELDLAEYQRRLRVEREAFGECVRHGDMEGGAS